MSQKPSVGRIVHYISNPGDDLPAPCRAAIITAVHDTDPTPEHGVPYVDLVVFEPNGQVSRQHVTNSEPIHQRGTWHWPERIEYHDPTAAGPQTVTVHVNGSVLDKAHIADIVRRHGDGTAWGRR